MTTYYQVPQGSPAFWCKKGEYEKVKGFLTKQPNTFTEVVLRPIPFTINALTAQQTLHADWELRWARYRYWGLAQGEDVLLVPEEFVNIQEEK